MSRDFPHLNDTKFPDLGTVDAYRYRNDYDYSKYGDTVKIKLLAVPWCGDYENVVYFDSKEERDKWFDAQNGDVREMSTMFRLYSHGDLKVDLPIDDCMNYNYLMVDYGKSPVQEHESDYRRMYYFISDTVQESMNATKLILDVDYWNSYIYDMGITYVNLVRGHAPMAATAVDEYLSNPLENSKYLLTQDVNYGGMQRTTCTKNVIFNGDGDVTLGFLTVASMQMSWAGEDGLAVIPTAAWESSQAFSSTDIFVIDDISDWRKFRDNVTAQCPQFFKTVKGMFIIPKKLINYANTWDFCGVTCHHLYTYHDNAIESVPIGKEMFGFDQDISEIAKLYTYPYSYIVVNDFKGGTHAIKIEDTEGVISVHTIMCDMYPFLNIEAYVLGIGGSSLSVRFVNNYDSRLTIGGNYYDFTTKWSIPIFSVQLEYDVNWALNAKIAANLSKTIAYRNADVVKENTALLVGKNSSSTSLANSLASDKTNVRNEIAGFQEFNANAVIEQCKNADIEATNEQATITSNTINSNAAVSASTQKTVSEINAGVGVVTGMVGGIAGASTPFEAAAGALSGLINGAVNGVASIATTSIQADAAVTMAATSADSVVLGAQVATGLRTAEASITKSSNTANKDATVISNDESLKLETTYNDDLNKLNNEYTAATTANSVTASKTNADDSYDASYAQTVLSTPPEFGQTMGTPDIISKPFGLSFNLVTQSHNAIRQAAEQFMRFGYALNMQWNINTFNVMKHYTYWKCSNIYCVGNVYEGAQSVIKSILENGVTVWRMPEDIGHVSIYDWR